MSKKVVSFTRKYICKDEEQYFNICYWLSKLHICINKCNKDDLTIELDGKAGWELSIFLSWENKYAMLIEDEASKMTTEYDDLYDFDEKEYLESLYS